MIKYIYILLSIVAVTYVFFKKRRFDFFSISILSTVAYCYPAYIGTIIVNDKYIPIHEKVYVCLIIHIIILFGWILVSDMIQHTRRANSGYNVCVNTTNNYSVLILSFVGLVLMLLTMSMYGELSSGGFAKNELLSNSSKVTEYFKFIALFVFVYAFVNTGKYIGFIRIMSLVLIGYTFLLGHRSFIVIGIVAVAFFAFSKQEKAISLARFMWSHKWLTLAILFAAFFFFFVKNVFSAFMDGNYELVVSRLTSKEYYLNMLLKSEPNSIMENLQYACQADIGFKLSDYFLGFFSLIPFLGGRVTDLFQVSSFEILLNEQFNDKYDLGFGMGSTFIGEAFSAGSFVFLVIVLIFMFAFISAVSKCLRKTKSSIVYTWLSISLVYCSFYIFRNSSINLFVMMRAFLYIVLVCWLVKKLIPRIVLSKKRRDL